MRGSRAFLFATIAAALIACDAPLPTANACRRTSDCAARQFCAQDVCVIDVAAPTLALTAPAAKALLSAPAILVEGSVSDGEGSGVASVEYSFDGLAFQPLAPEAGKIASSVPVPALDLSSATLTVRATDFAGNSGQAAVAVSIDRIAPAIVLTSPTKTRYTAADLGASISFHATATDKGGVSKLELSTDDGASWTASSDPTRFDHSVTVSADADGREVRVMVRATDAAGNRAAPVTSDTVFVDAKPPSLEITEPSATAATTTGATLSLAGTVSDPGLDRVVATLDGTSLSVTVTAGGFQSTVPVPLADLATHTLEVTAYDQAGNSTQRTRTFTSDRLAPTIQLKLPTRKYVNGDVQVEATASDARLASLTAKVGASSITDQDAAVPRLAGLWSISSAPADGPATLVVTACDDAQNCSTLSHDLFVDRVAPSATVDLIPSARSEAQLTFADDQVPARYDYAGAVAQALQNGSTVVKSASRFSWGPATPIAQDLLAANPRNIPFVALSTPLPSATEAPLGEATYDAEVVSVGKPPGGPLLSYAKGATAQGYLFPLCTETLFPNGLSATLPAFMDVRVTLVVADLAGNKAQIPLTLNLAITAPPPPRIVADATYASGADPAFSGRYHLADGSYGELFFGNATFAASPFVRLTRLVAKNPGDAPIALTLPSNLGTWTAREAWTSTVEDAAADLSLDGYDFPRSRTWVTSCPGDPGLVDAPCDAASPIPFHTAGSATLLSCASQEPTGVAEALSPAATSASLAWGAHAVVGGAESPTALAPSVVSGLSVVILPAASATEPGTLSLYLARPLGVSRTARPLAFASGSFSAVDQVFYRCAASSVPSGRCGTEGRLACALEVVRARLVRATEDTPPSATLWRFGYDARGGGTAFAGASQPLCYGSAPTPCLTNLALEH